MQIEDGLDLPALGDSPRVPSDAGVPHTGFRYSQFGYRRSQVTDNDDKQSKSVRVGGETERSAPLIV